MSTADTVAATLHRLHGDLCNLSIFLDAVAEALNPAVREDITEIMWAVAQAAIRVAQIGGEIRKLSQIVDVVPTVNC